MMQQLVGWRVTDPASGIVEVDASPYVSNSFGAITGGVHAMVMQAAAEAASPTASVVGLELHYLAQAREGGVRTLIERRRSDLFEVQLVHRDADGRFVTLGTVTLRTSWADPPGI